MKLKDSKIGHAEISILSVLANDMQLNRRNFAELGQKDIAETLKIKQPNVSRSIKRLKSQGYISVEGNRYQDNPLRGNWLSANSNIEIVHYQS